MRTEAVVEGLRVTACTFSTDGPEADGTVSWDSTTVVIVEAQSSGCVGTGWTFAPAAVENIVIGLLEPVVQGRDALAPVAAHTAMRVASRNAGTAGLVGMAISAVDIALWDLCARLHYVPVTRLLGGPLSEVEVYGSGGFTTYDQERLDEQVSNWLGFGVRAVKIKIGESWGHRVGRDLDRVRQVRELVGGDVEVFTDANGGYDVGQARRVGSELDELGVTWFEEPVSSDDLDGLAVVRSAVRADVVAGEYADGPSYVERMVRRSVDCLQIDVTRCGGYTGWLRCAAVAHARGVEVSGHCAPYLTLPVAPATPGLRHLEYFHDHVRIARTLFDGAPVPVAGRLAPRQLPGHGLTLRRSVVDEHRASRGGRTR
ncbi:enolase C-terminal domain-like protein [Nocardioides panacihumi]|uniref:Enolase C-terminal domain-like protein n=1 Tax=Nocardioides panacihumi TaxID=400774 RepID=A0ABN2QM29_9ACTN